MSHRTAEPNTVTFVLPYNLAVFGLTLGHTGPANPTTTLLSLAELRPTVSISVPSKSIFLSDRN